MFKPTLVVLAAGVGSRYGGLKQIDPVGPGGEIILDYSIYDALAAGFGRIGFVISEAMEDAFRQRVGNTIEDRCDVAYAFQKLDDVPQGFKVPDERKKPWGTAHATWACRDVVRAPFAVINADDFYGRSAYQALYHHLANAQDCDGLYDYCMVSYPLENTLSEHGHVARGVCTVDKEGRLVEIHERTRIERFGDAIKYTVDGDTWVKIPGKSPVSLNTWGFTPSLFAELETRFSRFLVESQDSIQTAEFFLPQVVGDLILEQLATVQVLPAGDRWFGVTYRQDRPQVERAVRDLIRQGAYPEDLWKDVR